MKLREVSFTAGISNKNYIGHFLCLLTFIFLVFGLFDVRVRVCVCVCVCVCACVAVLFCRPACL